MQVVIGFALAFVVLTFGTVASGQMTPNSAVKSLASFQYIEKVENATPDAKHLPLVIGLHWSSSTPEEFGQFLSGFDTPVRILLLRGPYEHPRGGRSFYVRQPTVTMICPPTRS